MGQPEKKTAEPGEAAPTLAISADSSSFLAVGGTAQCRYERLRAYVLTEPHHRARVSPAQFDLRRFNRFGLLGLVDGKPLRRGSGEFEIQLIPIGAEDAEDRLARLYELLAGMVTKPQGGADATGRALRQSFDRIAGEGANDPEPARVHYALR